MAFDAARQILANHAGMATIDTADDREAAFISAAIELALADSAIVDWIGRLMKEPRIQQALWPSQETE
jgi:hypothetical protein